MSAAAPQVESVMSSLRVMVVDDEKLSRIAMTRQLKEAGYESESFDNAYPALERLRSDPWEQRLN